MTLRIAIETDSFPAGTVPNGHGEILTSWDDILWAAVTVGRPNRQFVFQHGNASMYEALFRWSLVRMSLEQYGPAAYRLRRTTAARTLDPSEKGAINYFLGMTFCKLFAAQLLKTPWLLHLDVFRPLLNPVLTGRSRPDLVGKELPGNRWHAFECKGRISPPDATSKTKAKIQAQRLVSVSGVACSLHVGAITHFRNDVLHFYWRDPPADHVTGIDVPLGDAPWRYYYSPVVDLVTELDGWRTLLPRKVPEEGTVDDGDLLTVRQADLSVDIHPQIAKLLFERQWNAAHETALRITGELLQAGYKPDGIRIHAGPSWEQRFKESQAELT